MLTRREFLSKLIQITTAGILFPSNFKNIFFTKLEGAPLSDLVVVEGVNLKEMLYKGLQDFGGIKKFVKKDDFVIIHPNISWSGTPDMAVNTNPDLVGELVELCFSAGAKKVKVIDHTIRVPITTFGQSGIESAVKKAKGEIKAINSQGDFYKVKCKGTKVLKEVEIANDLKKADVLINVPVAKVHSATELTMCMKNLMGLVWDRKYFHGSDLNQCIIDLNKVIKPKLNILDATRILLTNGPQGSGKVRKLNKIALGKSTVEVDAFGCTLFNIKPEEIVYLKKAQEQKLGEIDINKLKIKYIKV